MRIRLKRALVVLQVFHDSSSAQVEARNPNFVNRNFLQGSQGKRSAQRSLSWAISQARVDIGYMLGTSGDYGMNDERLHSHWFMDW